MLTLLCAALALAICWFLIPPSLRSPKRRAERRAFRQSVHGDLAFLPVDEDDQ